MECNQDIRIRSLHVESCEQTHDGSNTGALVVKGGICCNNNMKIEKSLFCNCLTTNGLLGHNDNIKVNSNLVPTVNNINLGSEDMIWDNVFVKEINSKYSINGNQLKVNTLNVLTSAYIGASTHSLDNGNYSSILEVNTRDVCKNTSVVIRGDHTYFVNSENNNCYAHINSENVILNCNLKIGEQELPTLSVEPKENRVFVNGELILMGNGLIKSFKKINIDEDTELELLQEVSLLKIESNKNIKISVSDHIGGKLAVPGVTRRIVIYQNKNNNKITITNFDIKINFGIEIIFDGYKWILINAN
jgi:hypothetical protein